MCIHTYIYTHNDITTTTHNNRTSWTSIGLNVAVSSPSIERMALLLQTTSNGFSNNNNDNTHTNNDNTNDNVDNNNNTTNNNNNRPTSWCVFELQVPKV